jgi:hypothetical protein
MKVAGNHGQAGLGFGPIWENDGMSLFCSRIFRDLWGARDPVIRLGRHRIFNKISMFPSFP